METSVSEDSVSADDDVTENSDELTLDDDVPLESGPTGGVHAASGYYKVGDFVVEPIAGERSGRHGKKYPKLLVRRRHSTTRRKARRIGLTEQEYQQMRERRREAVTDENRQLIESREYFHGFLPREDAEELLLANGAFLVRETCLDGQTEMVISVRSFASKFRHFIVQVNFTGRFCIESRESFDLIDNLIYYYWDWQRSLGDSGRVYLMSPIGKSRWEFSDDEIRLLEQIGTGVCGKIYKGLLGKEDKNAEEVAVKLCEDDEHEVKLKFLAEARIMRTLEHPNICRFIGVSVVVPPLKLVLEHADRGDLLNFLRCNKMEHGASNITTHQKIHFALDATRGMKYLERKKILHLDLGARNCLVKSDLPAESSLYKVVISGFRMSRVGTECKLEEGEVVASRWAAPELLQNREATANSDVWSLGVVLWEIFTDGDVPYPRIKYDELVKSLMEENRMDPPPTCPRLIGEVMKKCWERQPERRPKLREVEERCLEELDFKVWPPHYEWKETLNNGEKVKRRKFLKPRPPSSQSSFVDRMKHAIGSLAAGLGLKCVYPGSFFLYNFSQTDTLLKGRGKIIEEKGGIRCKLLTKNKEAVDCILVDRRNRRHQFPNGNILVISCEGNSTYYEDGMFTVPVDAGYSALGWNHPGFGGSTGFPWPKDESAAVDVVVQYAINALGFEEADMVLFGWSIGGYSASWAAMNYPKIRGLILDATFDDLLPVALSRMPSSLAGLVEHTVRNHLDLPVARQVREYLGPVTIIRRTEDEFLCTDQTTVDAQRKSNRAKHLLKDLLCTRYPRLMDKTRKEKLDRWLDAETDSERVKMITELGVDMDDEACTDLLKNATLIRKNSAAAPLFPMDIGEQLGEEQKTRVVLFLADRYLVDFRATHCDPLETSLFQQPTHPWVK